MEKEAGRWIGYLEHQSNDLLDVFNANTGKGGCTIFAWIISRHYRYLNFSGLPWCATFVHAVCIEAYGKEKARKLLGIPHPGTRVMARRLRRKGRLMGRNYIPKPGDIIFCHNGDGRIGHCGIVARVERDIVVSIDGNTWDDTGVFPIERGGTVSLKRRHMTCPAIVAYGQMEEI